VLITSVVMLVRGQATSTAVAFVSVVLAGLATVLLAPWRHPRTPYGLLMAPIYLLFLLSIGWGLWVWDGPRNMGFASWWSLLVLLPTLIPFWHVGSRRWEDTPGAGERPK